MPNLPGDKPLDGEQTRRSPDSQGAIEGVPQWFPILRGIKGILEGWACVLTEPEYILGRGNHAQIRIWDPEVSREHAVISRTPAGYVVHDMGSLNGVFVNEVKVPRTLLSHGDVIRLGETSFLFMWSGELSLP